MLAGAYLMNSMNSFTDQFDVHACECYRGARFGLTSKTARVVLAFSLQPMAEPFDWTHFEILLDQQIEQLRPAGAPVLAWRNAALGMQDASRFAKGDELSLQLAPRLANLIMAMQQWAWSPVLEAKLLLAAPGRIDLAVAWEFPAAIKGAVEQALRLVLLVLANSSAEQFEANRVAFARWLAAQQAEAGAPSTFRSAMAARRKGIPLSLQQGILQLGWGSAAKKLDSTFTQATPNIAVRVARIKTLANQALAEAGIPVPAQVQVATLQRAEAVAEKLGWPVVVKPSNQDQGIAVTPGITTLPDLQQAFEAADKHSPQAVIVEKHVPGADHRMLVIGGRLRMVTRRHPGAVMGDGVHSVSELLAILNADPLRGTDKRSMLMRIELDNETQQCLTAQALNEQSIPAAGQSVVLRRTANISTGGTAEDVTLITHPDNRALAERAARVVGLDVAGVDFLCPDISRSWREVGGAICEVNAQPGLRVHWLGDPARDINAELVDWLMQGQDGRIPTAAITGTNGKTTVSRMLQHIWQSAGRTAGVCTTNEVRVGEEIVSQENLSGLPGARLLLNDPAVEAAVIELPRKGLLLFGHPCDRYDVAALLNVQDDHIGVAGIETLEQMAALKAEVLERASQAVVVNAEDPLCLAARQRAKAARHILVARNAQIPAVTMHCAAGGDAVVIQSHFGQPWVVLVQGAAQTPLMPLHDIPATMRGLLCFNESNALFAIGLAWAQGLPLEVIRQAMSRFHNSVEQNLGRYNFISGLPFELLLDFGHNPDGVRELCTVVQQLPVAGRRHLMNLKIANRHRAHMEQLAPLLARTFESFVLSAKAQYIKQCKDYASENPVATMLEFSRNSLLEAGASADHIICETDERSAVFQALEQAQPGDLVVLLAEPWFALPLVDEFKARAGRH